MKFTLGFILGAAVAALVVDYLNSEKGGALLGKLKMDFSKPGANTTSFGRELFQEAKTELPAKPGNDQHWPVAEPELPLNYNNIN